VGVTIQLTSCDGDTTVYMCVPPLSELAEGGTFHSKGEEWRRQERMGNDH
jgi:hypothetical protein